MNRLKIAVIGAGSWGTALAHVMAGIGHETKLLARDRSLIETLNETHVNSKYLPKIKLHPDILTVGDPAAVLENADVCLIVTPAQTVGEIARGISAHLPNGIPVISCAKGIDRQTGKLPTQTLAAHLGNRPYACLSGPSFADDVARNLPTAVTLACFDTTTAEQMAQQLSAKTFRVYAETDLVGVELGGALKNVIAVAVGVCRGMRLGASAEAALIARGFAELSRLAMALGADRETLMGLSGLGDLVLTCSGNQSRNFSYGMAIGSGQSTEGLRLAEGALTAQIAGRLAQQNGLDCPVIAAVNQLVDGSVSPADSVSALLARPLKKERE